MRVVDKQRITLVGLESFLQLSGDCVFRIELKNSFLLRACVCALTPPKHPFESGADVIIGANKTNW